MLLVVFAHVETYMLSIDPGETFLSSLFISFRMPLFFFICGYLVFKEGEQWTFKKWTQNIIKKMRMQIVPTMVFGLLYTYMFSLGDWYDFIANYHKFGYWFTIALFVMLFIVYSINCLLYVVWRESPKKLLICLLLVISIILFFFRFVYDKFTIISEVSNNVLIVIINLR
jgi:fucose 4-O-acetylase-like acetyltransferase